MLHIFWLQQKWSRQPQNTNTWCHLNVLSMLSSNSYRNCTNVMQWWLQNDLSVWSQEDKILPHDEEKMTPKCAWSQATLYSRLSVNRNSLKQNCCLNGTTASNMLGFVPEYCNHVHLSVIEAPAKLNIFSWSLWFQLTRVYCSSFFCSNITSLIVVVTGCWIFRD